METENTPPRDAAAAVLIIAAAIALLHVATNGRYGFHRDELQVLSDARHMDWGFVPYPPFTPFVERIGLEIFGLSLVGLRLFSVIAQALVIVVAGWIARDLGGGRPARITAALAVALSPLPLFEGSEFQYTSFDYLWWVLIAWFTVRLLKTENPRWWLAIGAAAGLGLQTKYTMVFLIAGILGGMLLTGARRYFADPWFWGGAALGLAIFLPNLLWQLRHGLISYHFLQHIHVRDVGEGRAKNFLLDQFIVCANLFAVPLWIAGLIAFLRGRRYRMLAWMYVIPFTLLWIGQGRGYYSAAAYPALIAMGAVRGERWVASLKKWQYRTVEIAFFSGLAATGLLFCAMILPLAPSGPLRDFAFRNSEDLREETGWNEMVETVAAIRESLPEEQRAKTGVLVGNYGEQGAIEILGPKYHLPPPISGTNSAWLRGYPQPPPSTLIVLGVSQKSAERMFTGCRVAGHITNPYGLLNEESTSHPDILVCGAPRMPWPEFWAQYQRFG